jgi:hypothetical protein
MQTSESQRTAVRVSHRLALSLNANRPPAPAPAGMSDGRGGTKQEDIAGGGQRAAGGLPCPLPCSLPTHTYNCVSWDRVPTVCGIVPLSLLLVKCLCHADERNARTHTHRSVSHRSARRPCPTPLPPPALHAYHRVMCVLSLVQATRGAPSAANGVTRLHPHGSSRLPLQPAHWLPLVAS